jgi:uncharacterized membrane protein YfcA
MAVVLGLAAVVQTALGFGATLVAVTLGAAALSVGEVLALVIPISVVQTAVVASRHRADIRWDVLLRRVLPFMGLGLGVGVMAVGPGGAPWLRPLLGVLVITLAARELLGGPARRVSRAAANGALVGGGFVQGVLATGGPLVVWALARESLPPVQVRATLTTVWLVTDLVLAAVMLRDGRVNAATLQDSAVLLLPVLLGVAVGERVAQRLDPVRFRAVVWVVLAIAGLPLVFGR